MPAERRRELWHEPLPAAELAGRLRNLPLFASVSVDELFRVAGAARQVRHDPGAVLLQQGTVPDSIHLLLDGRVTVSSRDQAPFEIAPPAALGFAEALGGMPLLQTVRTGEVSVTLALTVEELRTLLADNTDLVSGLFTTLIERADAEPELVTPTGAAREFEELAGRGLAPIEKVLALQRLALFARVSADEMRYLADLAQTCTMTAGAPLFAESAPPAIWVVLSGEVALESAAGAAPLLARPGDVIGAAAAMAGTSIGRSAGVVRSGFALRLDREDLFALLGERPEMLRQMFAGMFRVAGQEVVSGIYSRR
jgi:CRP-like cAMP-binding protein